MTSVDEKHVYANEKETSAEETSLDLHFVSDGIHDGLEFPTEEERKTLRRVADKLPINAYRMSSYFSHFVVTKYRILVIAFVELAERFSVCTQAHVFSVFRFNTNIMVFSFMDPLSSLYAPLVR